MKCILIFFITLAFVTNGDVLSPEIWSRRFELAKRYSEAAVELSNHSVLASSFSAGTTTTLGRENKRVQMAMDKLVQTPLLPTIEGKLSIVAIGGSITSGRMLDDYCKDCIPEIKYKHVWSGYLARALQKAAQSTNTPSSFNYESPSVVSHGINGASICAFARHASVHVARWLIEAKADVLLVELNVNDALPIRSVETHKCLEGLMRAAHESHNQYVTQNSSSSDHPPRELSVVLVDIPRIVASTPRSLINTVKEFDRSSRSHCTGARLYESSPNGDNVDMASNVVINAPMFEFAPSSRHVVMGAEYSHVQVAACLNDAEVSLAHALAAALAEGTLGEQRGVGEANLYLFPQGGVGGSACDAVTVGVTKVHNIKAAAAARLNEQNRMRRSLRMTNGASASDPFAVAACDGIHLTAAGQKLVAGLVLQLFSDALLFPFTLSSSFEANKAETLVEEVTKDGQETIFVESEIPQTPPLFASISDLIEFKPLILLEGSYLVTAVTSARCAVPGLTSRPKHAQDSKALVPLHPTICKNQLGFDSKGKMIALRKGHVVEKGNTSGGWSACIGVRKSILQEQSRRCTHPGIYFFDEPLGQTFNLKVDVPDVYWSNSTMIPSLHHHRHHKQPLQPDSMSKHYRISVSLLVSYENFGDVYVQVKFPDGSIFPPSLSHSSNTQLSGLASYMKPANDVIQSDGSDWVRLSGWHRLNISVPQPHPIATLHHPLPPFFELVVKAPNKEEWDGTQDMRWGTETSPLSLSGDQPPDNTLPPIKSVDNARITITSVFVSPLI